LIVGYVAKESLVKAGGQTLLIKMPVGLTSENPLNVKTFPLHHFLRKIRWNFEEIKIAIAALILLVYIVALCVWYRKTIRNIKKRRGD